MTPKSDIIASSSALRTVELGYVGPVLRSSTVSRLRHFATVLTLILSSRLSVAVVACDRCIAVLIACVVVAQMADSIKVVLSRFSSGLFRANIAMKKITNGKENRRVSPRYGQHGADQWADQTPACFRPGCLGFDNEQVGSATSTRRSDVWAA
jgi:hypothetical protein